MYAGVLFRSRLEARVAVFLDAIGARWEYEYEGFDLNGTRYLPDFWLPETYRRGVPDPSFSKLPSREFEPPKKGVWLEVKPNQKSSEEYGAILAELSKVTGCGAYLFCGNIRELDWHDNNWDDAENLTEYHWYPWNADLDQELLDLLNESKITDNRQVREQIMRLEELKSKGGELHWDNCMAFQSDGEKTTVEFREGNYAWGVPDVTAKAVSEALSYRFS